ncbi:MAG: glycogen synthase [Candidatus Levybacteria bacterium]|nr:glycogen synthase [Candidatus Levybacteria bacterium]
MKDLKVLITGYEAAPFYKRGGLGDVMGSLPKALVEIGVDAKVAIPYYNDIKNKYHFEKQGEFEVIFGGRTERVSVFFEKSVNVPFYFLENKSYLSLSKAKDKTKRMGQFAFFDLAIVEFIRWLGTHHKWHADIVHCNDWHTALIPLILDKVKLKTSTILTIHNLLYQGIGSLKVLDLLDIKDQETKVLKRGVPASEMNVLGEGIIHATRVSTVSPSYAKEIAKIEHDHNPISPFLIEREHEGLGRHGKIIGILNGIDYDIWNPAKDESIFHKFDVSNWEVGKKDNKDDLLKSLGLEDRPTFCFVGRMAAQKGLDILMKAINRISHLDINVIILGSGDPRIERSVLTVAKKFSWVKAELAYSEDLAHKIYAGSDFIIIPSRYEPCGLIQMIAMRYGTLPIASNTGGLKDSIANGKNGLLFEKGKSIRLKKAIRHALNIQKDIIRYRKMVAAAMRKDFSWDKSAVLYKKLYGEMIGKI